MKALASAVRRNHRFHLKITIAILICAAIAFVWTYDPIAQYLHPRALLNLLRDIGERTHFAPLVIGLIIGIGNTLFIPINALLLATALAFPGWPGFFYGMIGGVIAAVIQAFVGRHIGARHIEKRFGERFEIVRDELRKNGTTAVTTLCLVPIAPNIVTNLVAGVCRVPYWKLIVGTIIGYIPGLVILNLLGKNMRKLVYDPSVGAVLGGIGLVGILILATVIAKRYKARIEARAGVVHPVPVP